MNANIANIKEDALEHPLFDEYSPIRFVVWQLILFDLNCAYLVFRNACDVIVNSIR